MRIIYVFIVANLLINATNSQPLVYANFSLYYLGNLNGQNGWTNNSSNPGGMGSCAGAICTNNSITSVPLNYPNFDSTTNSLSLASDQDGVGTSFTSVNSGSIYLFLLCQFSSITTSSDVIRFMGGSNYSASCKLFIEDANGGFYAGIGKGSAKGSYNGSGPTFLDYNVPHLLVMKYTFKTTSSSDDIVTLYVDPDMSTSEPMAHEYQTSGGTDATLIDRLCFPYNASNKPTGYIGVVKVSTSWSDGFNTTGKCITPLGKSINGATVSASGTTTTVNTDTTGTFLYKLIGGNYSIRATKNNDINKTNGITSLDLALTQSHILGKTPLNSPYKVIAADVNGDGKVTTLDIVYMKRVILGLDTTFNNTISNQKRLWVFIDSSYSLGTLSSNFTMKLFNI